jgi:hypothetical protein
MPRDGYSPNINAENPVSITDGNKGLFWQSGSPLNMEGIQGKIIFLIIIAVILWISENSALEHNFSSGAVLAIGQPRSLRKWMVYLPPRQQEHEETQRRVTTDDLPGNPPVRHNY